MPRLCQPIQRGLSQSKEAPGLESRTIDGPILVNIRHALLVAAMGWADPFRGVSEGFQPD